MREKRLTEDSGTFRCKYTGPTRGPAYEAWREEWAYISFATDFTPIASDRIDCDISGATVSFAGVKRVQGTPMHLRRLATPAGPLELLFVIAASGCRAEVSQRGQDHDLPWGHIALMSANEPVSGSQLTAGTWHSIGIPRRLLAEGILRLDDKVGKRVPAPEPLTKLLLHQATMAQQVGPELPAEARFALAQHILDLVSLCIGASKDATELARKGGLAAARLDAIKSDILCNLLGGDVRLPSVARRHRLSERYVQKLFENAGTSFTGFVIEQRLTLAARDLRNPMNRWRKISDIAVAAGFSDVSYFNRAFKARFGATPSEFRGELSRHGAALTAP